VFHSEWWLREHWGRAFDVVEYWPSGFGMGGPGTPPLGQGCAVLRARDVQVTVEDLERPSDDPREWAAVEENLDVLQRRESAWRARAEAAETELAAVRATRSWRMARAIAAVGRPFRGAPRS
jgi:hypothetical protein